MEKTFEENVKELEKLTKSLESGELNLEQAIETFEKGIKLSKAASDKLDKAERKINILLEDDKEEKFEVE